MKCDTIKFSLYQKRVAIVALYECRQTAKEITKMLKKLINEQFIFRTHKHYRETGDIKEQAWEGRLHSVPTSKLVHAVHERV